MFLHRRVSSSSPERWTSSACSIASRPIRGSVLPLLSLIELIAEPARNRTFWAIPWRSTSCEIEDDVALIESAGAGDHGRLDARDGRVRASSEACHSRRRAE